MITCDFLEGPAEAKTIRDDRLYREDYATFEDYCRDRWDISRPRAYQFIDSAQVSENLSTMVDKGPVNERQVRPLTKLPAEQQAEAWQKAVEKYRKFYLDIPGKDGILRAFKIKYRRSPDSGYFYL